MFLLISLAKPTMMEHPKNFESYVSMTGDGIIYREVFAFQCSFGTGLEPFSVLPTITWEQCNPDTTYSPIMEATATVVAPGYAATDDIFTLTHVFFQTEATGYLHIHDTNNSAYLNAQYRCKARSSIAQDTQPSVYSDCAKIIHHPYTEGEFFCLGHAHNIL